MNLNRLNPVVRDAVIYERIDRTEECVAYDARLLYVMSGDVSAVVGGKKLGHLTFGNMLYIPAGTPYKLKAQYIRMAVISFDLYDKWLDEPGLSAVATKDFDPELVRALPDSAPFDKVIKLDDMTGVMDDLSYMCELTIASEGEYSALLSARMKLVLIRIAEATDEHALPERMVDALGKYIRENVGEDISNTEVGAIFGYHPFYISNVLKSAKGLTLKQYIISYRLKLACRMLAAGNRSIADIAEDCGFTDSSYFAKTFRHQFGVTPKEYRNKFKEEFI